MKRSLITLALALLSLRVPAQEAEESATPAEPAPQPATQTSTAFPTVTAESISNRLFLARQRRLAQTNATEAVPTGATVVTNAPAAAGATGLPRVVPRPAAGTAGTASAPGAGTSTASTASTASAAGESVGSVPAPGAEGGSGEASVTIKLQQADLPQALDFYADLVNRTVLRPASLPAQQQITLVTKAPITRQEAIQAMDAVLGMNGITMINVGEKFVKAVQQQAAGQEGQVFSKAEAEQLSELGQFMSQVVQLKYAKPSELMSVLQPFAKAQNGLLPIDTSQIIVLRDYSENVKRMLELIKQIDVPTPAEYISEVIPIKYAKASEIAAALNSLSSGGGGATVGAGGGTGTAGQGTGFGGSRGGFGSRGMGMGMGMGMGGCGSRSYGGYGGGYGGYGGGYGMTPYAATPAQPVTQPGAAGGTPSFTDRLRNIIARSGAGQDEFQVLGQTKMIADERTNSLLIYAGKDDMKTIKEIVSKLDVVLAQVLIEAVILQVGLQDNTTLGVSWLERKPHGGDFFSGIGAIRNGTLATDGALAAITNAGGGFSYLGRFGDDLNVAITAIASDTRAKILQRPRIQTSHNEPASLFVGESRPYPTGSYYGGGAYGGYSSIQQIPIGVTLQVTPLINPDGLVVMEILQDIQAVAGQVTIANVGDVPITSTKNASAIVSVRDRDTIMLGGLIETTREKNNSGVPVLKDVPLLGHLFRSSTDREVRNELVVLIRPTVLPTPEVAALAAKSEKDRMPLVKSADAEFEAMYEKRMREADYEVDRINRAQAEDKK